MIEAPEPEDKLDATVTVVVPSKAAVRRIRERLPTDLRSLRGTNAQAVIKRLNPIRYSGKLNRSRR